jgi:hypothetical protein
LSFDSLLIHTVTIYNSNDDGVDRYGNTIQLMEAGVTTRARVDQLTLGGSARELLVDRDTRQTYYTVFLPADTPVNGLSVIHWGSRRLAVEGEPADVYNSATEHHIEVMCKEVLG